MGVAELYTALQQGTVDAVESSPGFFYSGKYFESTQNILLEPNGSQVVTLATSKKWLDSLPADLQKIVKDTAKEVIPEANEYAKKEAVDTTAKMQKEGRIKVSEASKEFHQAMIEATKQVYAKLYDRVPAAKKWVEDIQKEFPQK